MSCKLRSLAKIGASRRKEALYIASHELGFILGQVKLHYVGLFTPAVSLVCKSFFSHNAIGVLSFFGLERSLASMWCKNVNGNGEMCIELVQDFFDMGSSLS